MKRKAKVVLQQPPAKREVDEVSLFHFIVCTPHLPEHLRLYTSPYSHLSTHTHHSSLRSILFHASFHAITGTSVIMGAAAAGLVSGGVMSHGFLPRGVGLNSLEHCTSHISHFVALLRDLDYIPRVLATDILRL